MLLANAVVLLREKPRPFRRTDIRVGAMVGLRSTRRHRLLPTRDVRQVCTYCMKKARCDDRATSEAMRQVLTLVRSDQAPGATSRTAQGATALLVDEDDQVLRERKKTSAPRPIPCDKAMSQGMGGWRGRSNYVRLTDDNRFRMLEGERPLPLRHHEQQRNFNLLVCLEKKL